VSGFQTHPHKRFTHIKSVSGFQAHPIRFVRETLLLAERRFRCAVMLGFGFLGN
jgi:hypothetical protein